jgi:hypothetical protein
VGLFSGTTHSASVRRRPVGASAGVEGLISFAGVFGILISKVVELDCRVAVSPI